MQPEPPKNVIYGGSMIRDITSFPGMLDNFVTATRKYKKKDFNKVSNGMSNAFSHTNGTPVEDDYGTEWPRGSLLNLGTEGKDYGKHVILVHKFIPISRLYTEVDFNFLNAGSKLQFAPMETGG